MKDFLKVIETWRESRKPVAIATNVKLEGASLRPLGAKMIMTSTMDISGSVTGGCIEGVVYQEAQEVLKDAKPKLLHYGLVDADNPAEVGLSCGSSLDVFVESLDSPAWLEIYPALKTLIEQNQPAVVATVISGSELGKKMMLGYDGYILGTMGIAGLNTQVQEWMKKQLTANQTSWKSFSIENKEIEVFVDVFSPSSRLIIIGAVHVAIPLVTLAKALGYYTIVIDPRKTFATKDRFSHADELIVDWPSTALENLQLDENTYIAVISHDEKLDNPALAVALTSSARYIGVLGTRKNLPRRLAALQELGVSQEQFERLRAPIGIHLGAVEPEEIALSILAEIVSAKRGLPKTQ